MEALALHKLHILPKIIRPQVPHRNLLQRSILILDQITAPCPLHIIYLTNPPPIGHTQVLPDPALQVLDLPITLSPTCALTFLALVVSLAGYGWTVEGLEGELFVLG